MKLLGALFILMLCVVQNAAVADAQQPVVLYCQNSGSTPAWAPCTTTGGVLNVNTSSTGTYGSGLMVKQVIGTTGTAIAMPSQAFTNYMICEVVSLSGQQVSYGYSASVTAPSVTAFGSSAVGIYLSGGQLMSDVVNNSNLVYINGNSGDGVQCIGH